MCGPLQAHSNVVYLQNTKLFVDRRNSSDTGLHFAFSHLLPPANFFSSTIRGEVFTVSCGMRYGRIGAVSRLHDSVTLAYTRVSDVYDGRVQRRPAQKGKSDFIWNGLREMGVRE